MHGFTSQFHVAEFRRHARVRLPLQLVGGLLDLLLVKNLRRITNEKKLRQEPPNLAMVGCWELHPNYQIAPNYSFLDWYSLSSVILCVHSNLFFYSGIITGATREP